MTVVALRCALVSQGEIVYKNLEMSQGVYFVTKGIAEAYVKAGESGGVEGIWETEEKVKGIASPGKIFGYTRWDLQVFGPSRSVSCDFVKHAHSCNRCSSSCCCCCCFRRG